jgi:hypothetical protein
MALEESSAILFQFSILPASREAFRRTEAPTPNTRPLFRRRASVLVRPVDQNQLIGRNTVARLMTLQ